MTAEPTPRTNEFISRRNIDFDGEWVWRDFARQLERELSQSAAALAQAQRERDNYKFAAESCAGFSAVVIADRDALQRDLSQAQRERDERQEAVELLTMIQKDFGPVMNEWANERLRQYLNRFKADAALAHTGET